MLGYGSIFSILKNVFNTLIHENMFDMERKDWDETLKNIPNLVVLICQYISSVFNVQINF
jgi:hypothetical protein